MRDEVVREETRPFERATRSARCRDPRSGCVGSHLTISSRKTAVLPHRPNGLRATSRLASSRWPTGVRCSPSRTCP